MSNQFLNDTIIEAYITEASQLVEKLEFLILGSEDTNSYTTEAINEIFRIVHTIKGSSAMMEYNDISTLAHSIEDLFYFIREDKPSLIDYKEISDLILEAIDFIKVEVEKVKKGQEVDGKCDSIIEKSKILLMKLKNANPKSNAIKDRTETKSLTSKPIIQETIRVKVDKLDKLMDLVEEMVIVEAMVTHSPDLKGLEINNFLKASRHLHKITSELQDSVMSLRMVPISIVFRKMNRIVHDMSKKLDKKVQLKLIGEDTEVDKNIIEHISDPLMHLVRNCIDHGIEDPEGRKAASKDEVGTVTLEAKNEGNYVIVRVEDDGAGLDKQKILEKAEESGILNTDPSKMSDKEISNLIFQPGFSTNKEITEFSGRGVGMDVVIKNIEEIGGSVVVDSVKNKGCTFTIKIPLTLAIIDGMNIKVGNSHYTIPVTCIKEFFRPQSSDIIIGVDGKEMIMLRKKCYPIIRIHRLYNIKTNIEKLTEGVIILVEQDGKSICLFVDELLGQQQIVVKPLPNYIKRMNTAKGIAECTLLGDGSISLILSISELIE